MSIINLNFELEPNCLITVYPILFLRRPLSWRNRDLFIPLFLREHGYEIEIHKLNSIFKHSLIVEIQSLLQRFDLDGKKIHLIADPICKNLVLEMQKTNSFPCLQSVTDFPSPLSSKNLMIKASQLLHHIKELAESDYS